MAQKSRKGKYLQLSDVRVSYDARYDVISLTAADPELTHRGGLKFDVGSKSRNYAALRSLLVDHGLIHSDPWVPLGRQETADLMAKADPGTFVLGTDISGDPVVWKFGSPHPLCVVGDKLSQTNLIHDAVLQQALSRGWRNLLIDLRSSRSAAYDFYGDLIDAGAAMTTLRDAHRAVGELLEISERRFHYLDLILERDGHLDVRANRNFEPVLLTVADVYGLARAFFDSQSEEMAEELVARLRRLISEGPRVGIYTVLGAPLDTQAGLQPNEEDALPFYLARQFSFEETVAIGPLKGSLAPGMILPRTQSELKTPRGWSSNRGTLLSRNPDGTVQSKELRALQIMGYSLSHAAEQDWKLVRLELQLSLERDIHRLRKELNTEEPWALSVEEPLPRVAGYEHTDSKPSAEVDPDEEAADPDSPKPKSFQEIYDEEAVRARRLRRSRRRSSEVRFA